MKLLLLLWLLQIYPGQTENVEPGSQLIQILQKADGMAALWSVSVRNGSGEEILEANARKLATPASNLKILTAASIYDALGESATLQTKAFLKGRQRGGVFDGNLIISGGGDPSMNKIHYADPLSVLESLAEKIKQLGITEIRGSVTADVSFFDNKPYPEGWEWNDLTYYFGVPLSALNFNNNAVDLTVVASGPVGGVPEISWYPFNTGYIDFVNSQRISVPDSKYQESYLRLAGSRTIVLKSVVPQGYIEKESLSIPDPAGYTIEVLTAVLRKRGITVAGRKLNPRETPFEIWTHVSPVVSTLMREVLAKSSNFYTETLLKAAAARKTGLPGSTEAGIQLTKQWLADHGIDSTATLFKDGSGLYAGTLWSATGISATLHAIRSMPYFSSFKENMAVPGGYGTLNQRFSNAAFAKKIRVKTGYLAGVRSLSGYMETASGNEVSFSLVTNHFVTKTAEIDRVHEQILNLIFEKL